MFSEFFQSAQLSCDGTSGRPIKSKGGYCVSGNMETSVCPYMSGLKV